MPRDQIQEVKDKLDIVSVISSYFPLTKSGKNYKACCPFHSEKTPSFMVSPELQIFKCFGCGEGGDVISFYAKMETVGYGEALREMAKRAGVKLVSRKKTPEEEKREILLEINRLAADFFHYLLTEHRVGEAARKYFKDRGLSDETIETFHLGYAPESWDNLGKFILSKNYTLTDYLASGLGVRKDGGRGFYDFIRGRVVFPLRSSSGQVTGFSARTLSGGEPKYINTPETPVFKKGSLLFNLDLAKQEIKKSREAVLVEGEMDAIALYEKGVKNVVASKGTALTPDQVAAIARFAETVKICFDRDTAGLEAAKRGILLAHGIGLDVKAVIPPQGKDPDEAIRADEKKFRRALEDALPIFDFYLNAALERFDVSSPSGKKRIAGEILPILKAMANEVEKAAYIRKLASILDVPEESLRSQFAKEKSIAIDRSGERTPGASKLPYPKREAYFLTLVLSLSQTEVKRWLRRLAPEDFTNSVLGEFFAALKSYVSQVKRFRLSGFSAKLEKENRKVLEELTLSPLPKELAAEDELDKVVPLLKQARYRREKQTLTKEIKKAEAAGKTQEVRKLQREALKLSEKIQKP